jgi:hypothetical protein
MRFFVVIPQRKSFPKGRIRMTLSNNLLSRRAFSDSISCIHIGIASSSLPKGRTKPQKAKKKLY